MLRKYKIAAEDGRRFNRRFFIDNPDRLYWVRASLQHELPGWDDNEHLVQSVMIVCRKSRHTLEHSTFAAIGELAMFPNTDRFLAIMRNQIIASAGQEQVAFGVGAHAAMLKMAGFSLIDPSQAQTRLGVEIPPSDRA